MLFNSIDFILFSCAFFPLYFLSRGTVRLYVLLSASYFFYGWWDARFVTLLFGVTVVSYTSASKIALSTNPLVRNRWLIGSIFFQLLVLSAFKYFDFFIVNFVAMADQFGLDIYASVEDSLLLGLILPVGISFYTFQAMSYTIDVYRGHMDAEPNFLNFAVYVSLFPQLVAGPIVRASALLPQLRQFRTVDWGHVGKGCELVIWGLFLKIGMADNLGQFVDPRFANPAGYSNVSVFLATFFFAFQIYGDFAGYSLVAVGIGRVLGFDFGVNFVRPYFSIGFSDFWQRWHVSLSSWIRDYVYIPFGGNRGGQARTFFNLVVTMLLAGLWHGAGWTFVVWGLLHGLFLVLQRLGEKIFSAIGLTPTWVARLVGWGLTFYFTLISWIFFRADTVADALVILEKFLLPLSDTSGPFGGQRLLAIKGLVLITIVVIVDAFVEKQSALVNIYQHVSLVKMASLAGLIVMLGLFGAFGATQFIYFQF